MCVYHCHFLYQNAPDISFKTSMFSTIHHEVACKSMAQNMCALSFWEVDVVAIAPESKLHLHYLTNRLCVDAKWTLDKKKGSRFHVTPCFIWWGWRSLNWLCNKLNLIE